MNEEKAQELAIEQLLDNLVGCRYNVEDLEEKLNKELGIKLKGLDDVSRDDDELCDYNLLGSIDRELNGVHIYAYFDIYFLKMRTNGFDDADMYITEVSIEFE